MAILAVGVAAAAVAGGAGAALGASAATVAALASLGFAFGTTLGSMLFPPTAPDSRGPRLTDLQIQSASYGVPITLGYGVYRIPGFMLWGMPIEERSEEEEVDSGGKGKGGGGSTITSYTYWGHVAIGYCVGPVSHFRRVWADGKLIYDTTGETETSEVTVPAVLAEDLEDLINELATATNEAQGSGLDGGTEKYPGELRFHLGSETQLPDALIEADKGAGQVPAFRGLAYMVVGVGHGFPLADFGNRYPVFTAEICRDTDAIGPVEETPEEPEEPPTEAPEAPVGLGIGGVT